MKTIMQTLILTLSLLFFFTACGGGKNGNTTHDKAIEKLTAYAQSNGTSEVPTLQDYLDAGVTGIDTDAKLAELNQVVEGLTKEEVDTTEEVQALANALGVTVTIPTTPTPVKPKPAKPSPTLDTTPPVITITGGSTTSVVQLSTYTDAGATATDAVDGAVSVTTTGSVDTNTTGSYIITYTATDAAGNAATATRTVTVTVFSITHNGTPYGAVVSPYTGKVWLDRNLGASRVCTSFNDRACYGDYYQWGRNADGHESGTGTSTRLAINVNNAGSSFILSPAYPYDWASTDSNGSQRSANWSKTDGSSVCPVGFRVPTITELSAETLDQNVTNGAAAFANFLKLPSAGVLDYSTGGGPFWIHGV